MSDANPIASPNVGDCKLIKTYSYYLLDATYYRSIVGALRYVSITHPKIGFSFANLWPNLLNITSQPSKGSYDILRAQSLGVFFFSLHHLTLP
ncbi:hypothetical protein CR513_23258, partial [Mucuna pruriens]